MSTRNMDTDWCVGKRLINLSGSFVPLTGAGTVVAATVKGFGFGYAPVNGVMTLRGTTGGNSPVPKSTPGIVRTSAGLYTVTAEDPYLDCTEFTCDLAVANTGSALWAQPVEPVANLGVALTAPAFQILLVNAAGSPTDAAAGQRVYFDIQFRDSTTGYQKP